MEKIPCLHVLIYELHFSFIGCTYISSSTVKLETRKRTEMRHIN